MKRIPTTEGWKWVREGTPEQEAKWEKFSKAVDRSLGRPTIIIPSPDGYHPYRGVLNFKKDLDVSDEVV